MDYQTRGAVPEDEYVILSASRTLNGRHRRLDRRHQQHGPRGPCGGGAPRGRRHRRRGRRSARRSAGRRDADRIRRQDRARDRRRRGYRRYGVTAELASVIAEGAFYHLDAPVRRLGAMDVPIPFSPLSRTSPYRRPSSSPRRRGLCGRGKGARRWPPRSSCRPSASLQETRADRGWLAVEGDTVTEGEPLFEIETDKVTVSIDALPGRSFRRSGRTTATRCRSGGSSRTSSHREEPPMPWRARPPPAARPNGLDGRTHSQAEAVPGCRVVLTRIRQPAPGIPARAASGEGGWDRTRAGPRNRTGRSRDDGRHGRSDRGGCSADRERGRPDGTAEPGPVRSEVGAVWRRMAERVTASWTQAPHFYLTREVDAEHLVTRCAALGEDVTITDMLVSLSARALERHPRGERRLGR